MRQEVLDYIAKDIQSQCERLGIVADFSVKDRHNYRGEPYKEVESTPFRQIPTIFKRIYVGGTINEKLWAKNKEFTEVRVNLDFRWQTFDGGANGTSLGRCVYLVDNDIESLKEIKDTDFLIHVRKQQGIML